MSSDQKFSMRPLYLQVRDLVLERITSGVWKPGAMLPAEVDLARELGVSSGTARKALDALEAERVVSRRQGRGTFVNDSTAQELAWRYDNIRGKDGRRIVGAPSTSELRSQALWVLSTLTGRSRPCSSRICISCWATLPDQSLMASTAPLMTAVSKPKRNPPIAADAATSAILPIAMPSIDGPGATGLLLSMTDMGRIQIKKARRDYLRL